MLVYSQTTGKLTEFGTGKLIGQGYSGYNEGLNNPSIDNVHSTGPIPRGFWRIGDAYHSKNVGPATIPLYKLDINPSDDVDQLTGRSAFRIHGDNAKGDKSASRGCIILPRIVREVIISRKDELLWVTR